MQAQERKQGEEGALQGDDIDEEEMKMTTERRGEDYTIEYERLIANCPKTPSCVCSKQRSNTLLSHTLLPPFRINGIVLKRETAQNYGSMNTSHVIQLRLKVWLISLVSFWPHFPSPFPSLPPFPSPPSSPSPFPVSPSLSHPRQVQEREETTREEMVQEEKAPFPAERLQTLCG